MRNLGTNDKLIGLIKLFLTDRLVEFVINGFTNENTK